MLPIEISFQNTTYICDQIIEEWRGDNDATILLQQIKMHRESASYAHSIFKSFKPELQTFFNNEFERNLQAGRLEYSKVTAKPLIAFTLQELRPIKKKLFFIGFLVGFCSLLLIIILLYLIFK